MRNLERTFKQYIQHMGRPLTAMLLLAFVAMVLFLSIIRVVSAWSGPDVTGSVAGRVIDVAGHPVAGVMVTLYRQTQYEFSYHSVVTTGDTGTFLFDYLPTGIYRLGFVDEDNRYHRVYYSNALLLEEATDILIAGNDVTDITQVVHIGGRMRGAVELWNGAPLDSLSVALYRNTASGPQYVTGYSSYNSDHQARSLYAFSGLQPGDYHVEVKGGERLFDYEYEYYTEFYTNGTSHDDATFVSVAVDSDVTGIDVVLGENPNQTNVGGQVNTSGGGPIPGLKVSALISNTWGWDSVRSTMTADDGSYSLRTLDPGLYKIRYGGNTSDFVTAYYSDSLTLDGASVISLSAGIDVQDLNMSITPTGGISGSVTMLDGEPPDSVDIFLYAARTTYSEIAYSFYRYNSDGLPTYKVTGLEPGIYRLFFRVNRQGISYSEFYQDALALDEGIDVVVKPGLVTGHIDAVLGENPVYAQISGHVSTLAGSRPLATIDVTAYRKTEYGFSYSSSTVADKSGNYQFSGLLTGTYKIGFEDSNYYDAIYDNRYYPDATELDDALPISVTEGQVISGVDVTLESDGIITGTITEYDGRPYFSSTVIRLYQFQADNWTELDSNWFYPYNNHGTYILSGLADGVYRVSMETGYSPNEVVKFYPDTETVTEAMDIAVVANRVAPNINFVIGEDPAAARVEGTVTFEGVPQPGFHVELYYDQHGWGDWWRLVYVIADAQGHFVIDGLEEGAYRLCAVDPTSVIDHACYWGAETVEEAYSFSLADGEVVGGLRMEMAPSEPYQLFLPVIARE